MKNIALVLVVILSVTLGSTALEAKHKNGHQDHQLKSEQYHERRTLKVRVDGIVCSFCAYGLEKNLSKLPFVKTKEFGGDGILVNVKTGFVTITLNDSKKVNFGKIVKAITKGGYIVREMHLNLSGVVIRDENSISIKDAGFPYFFILKESDETLFDKTLIGKTTEINAFFEIPKKFKDKKKIQISLSRSTQ
jgi:hypothetical protein